MTEARKRLCGQVNLCRKCSWKVDILVDELAYVTSKYSSWWRPLKDVFRFRLQKTSSRRLQDFLMKTNIFLSTIRLQKTSSRRLDQNQYIRLAHTSSRRFQDVFKTSCKNVFKTSSRRFQDVFKTSSRRLAKTSSKRLQDVLQIRLEDIFKTFWRRLKTSWRHLQGVFLRRLQDVFKTFVQVKLFFLTSLSLKSI